MSRRLAGEMSMAFSREQLRHTWNAQVISTLNVKFNLYFTDYSADDSFYEHTKQCERAISSAQG